MVGDLGNPVLDQVAASNSNALVGAPGWVYIGSIVVLPSGGGTATGGGGSSGTANPSPVSVTVSGAIPGSAFTIPTAPGPTQTLVLFVNGSFQRPVTDYTLSGVNITTTIALTADDTIDALMIG